MAGRRVQVRGLRECTLAFEHVRESLDETVREGLKHAAEPVRVLAERRAVEEIGNMPSSPKWAEQKIVVSKRTALVYMAPRKRQTRAAERKRKNLAPLLMDRAMEPALEHNEERVTRSVEVLLDTLGRKNGF